VKIIPTLLLGSGNPGKLRELRQLFLAAGMELVSPEELGLDLNVEEAGSSYAANAQAKALAYARAGATLAVADDSGLEVDALDGAPGPLSARLAGPGATDADRRRKLLGMLSPTAKPWKAHFRSVMALADPGGILHLSEGVCEGEIIPDERGKGGFGYDPIFVVGNTDKTMAELSLEEKNRISHRARASAAILAYLTR
jgi:XTP/dITP diphosphohydrolase